MKGFQQKDFTGPMVEWNPCAIEGGEKLWLCTTIMDFSFNPHLRLFLLYESFGCGCIYVCHVHFHNIWPRVVIPDFAVLIIGFATIQARSYGTVWVKKLVLHWKYTIYHRKPNAVVLTILFAVEQTAFHLSYTIISHYLYINRIALNRSALLNKRALLYFAGRQVLFKYTGQTRGVWVSA